jgi:sugar phosphate isomerase/epimerase
MKLGFVSAIFPDLSLDTVLAFARAQNFATVELMCWPVGKAERKYAGVTHVDVTGFTAAQADDINARCALQGVTISALGYYPNPLDPDRAAAKRAIDHLKRVIRAAALLGLKNVNTFAGRDWTQTVDENWPRFLKTWHPLIAFAADHDIKLGIENCPMSFTRDEWPGGKNLFTTPAIWRRAFNDLPAKNFGLNYDPSHFVLQHMDAVAPLREFKSKLFHVHAKDVRIDRRRLNDVGIFAYPLEWHQPRIPGAGDLDWPAFMHALRATGYDGPICIEVEDASFGSSLAGRKRALRTAHTFLQPYFA